MSSTHTLLKYTRLVHLYFGVFITPALIFFAFTGALQTFSLHETTRGSSYKPPAWAMTLAQIHKKQTTVVPQRKQPPPDRSTPDKPATDNPAAGKPAGPPPAPQHNPLPLKLFFLVVSIGLFTSTLTGLYMSYKYIRNRRLITAILLAGIVLPVALALL